MLEVFIEILLIGLTGYVFNSVLILPGMILDFYGDFLEDRVKVKSHKLADALGLCVYCFSGQLALWYYVLTRYVGIDNDNFLIVGFVSGVIFLIAVIKKKWKI